MENSEIRKIILAEHDALRKELQCIEAGLAEAAVGDVQAQRKLHEQLEGLVETFAQHIAHEEQILRPALTDIDAWGPQRIAQMEKEHQEQDLAVRLAQISPGSEPTWVDDVRVFIAHLREDMACEEKNCLEVLRDEASAEDSFGG